ncbi:nitroreductase [Actinomadura vinacea]|uniref:Nitroreductase n=1 Tax=Actinomadura vinacea TaxID=115336 RepID=A0ABP5WT74_9ACTN
MDVYEAVTSRRAVRGFTDRHVPRDVLERVLSAAAWSPSGSNLQPWHAYVLTGGPLADLKKRADERVAAGDPWDEREYEMYPPELKSPYHERRSTFGKERYSALGVSREDWEARQRAASANWQCFGAPAALFCYIDRDLGLPQWADVGMYLQTVMLLLRAEGLHSCPQMAWSVYRKTVAEILSPPDGLILFCGMSIGFEDVTVDYIRTGRAPLDETVTFVEGGTAAVDPREQAHPLQPTGPDSGRPDDAARASGHRRLHGRT